MRSLSPKPIYVMTGQCFAIWKRSIINENEKNKQENQKIKKKKIPYAEMMSISSDDDSGGAWDARCTPQILGFRNTPGLSGF